ncbi:MAG: hypothetical protein JNK58_07675, partial [Phycisphaerae bacterium]|nr:hypothetical protein [Phycisphaerae bacterium]
MTRDLSTAAPEQASNPALPQRPSAWLRGSVYTLCLMGAALVGIGGWWWSRPINPNEVAESTASSMLLDVGGLLLDDLSRVVRPAMDRTQKLAASPSVIRALKSGDAAARTSVCNEAITASTEIDAVALFDRSGAIVAINTVYPSGQPIPRERVDRVMGLNFDNRGIVQQCARNTSHESV